MDPSDFVFVLPSGHTFWRDILMAAAVLSEISGRPRDDGPGWEQGVQDPSSDTTNCFHATALPTFSLSDR
jgi:hypothetical protein